MLLIVMFLDEGEFYKGYKSDCRYYIIIWKDLICKFRIRASLLKKQGVVITILTTYSYSSAIYYKANFYRRPSFRP